jgi:hypothetical protein
MGPLNEFERRFLDVTQQRRWLMAANIGGPPPEFFGYPLTFGSAANPLTPGTLFQGTIALQADAWFLWQYLSIGVTLPATPNFGGPEQFSDPGNLLVEITNPGTGDELINLPAGFAGTPGSLISGVPLPTNAGIPYIFPTPVLLPPNTNINVSVSKLGINAGADNPDMTGAYVMMFGARIQVWS